MSQRILLVEDEPEVRQMTAFALSRAGFSVDEVPTAEAAIKRLAGVLPTLVLIDWMLPGMNGVELARRIRADQHTSELPMIMLTARGEEGDKLRGFELGIDDYVTKPFSPKELIARIRAVLRRADVPADGVLEAGNLRLDLNAHQLYVGTTPVNLAPIEFRLLEVFMGNPGRVFERPQLLDRVWGRDVFVEERTVDVQILRLRRALKPHDADGCIETLRGIGYRFRTSA
jgi:two-component system phosphate regulon response regulator PhoB